MCAMLQWWGKMISSFPIQAIAQKKKQEWCSKEPVRLGVVRATLCILVAQTVWLRPCGSSFRPQTAVPV